MDDNLRRKAAEQFKTEARTHGLTLSMHRNLQGNAIGSFLEGNLRASGSARHVSPADNNRIPASTWFVKGKTRFLAEDFVPQLLVFLSGLLQFDNAGVSSFQDEVTVCCQFPRIFIIIILVLIASLTSNITLSTTSPDYSQALQRMQDTYIFRSCNH
jgi:hypothetical protein